VFYQAMAAHLPEVPTMDLSILRGPTELPLWDITLSQLLQQQVEAGPSRQCVIFPEVEYRATYEQLYARTLEVAKGLIAAGIRKGDNIGILAGNCPPYVELFFAASHVGAALVVVNCTYTPAELMSALKHSGFIIPRHFQRSS
jgi:acyl-CoA synthetase (AMP-forming)/AMP-acid ligase II